MHGRQHASGDSETVKDQIQKDEEIEESSEGR